MKRHPGLMGLSEDHHGGLVQARWLRQAAGLEAPRRGTAVSPEQATQAFLEFWRAELNRHLEVEEQLLLPARSRYAPEDHPLAVRMLLEHVRLRRLVLDLGRRVLAGTAHLSLMGELGRELEAHIRFEERELFPLIESEMPEEALSELVELTRSAERASCTRHITLSLTSKGDPGG